MRVILLSVFLFLTACGGSSGSSSTTTNTPPATSPNAIVLNTSPVTINTTGDFLVSNTAVTMDATISSAGSNITFAQNQPCGTVTIGGSGNTVIFRSGATVTSLSASGSGNTIWIPTGAQITFASTPPVTVTVKYY